VFVYELGEGRPRIAYLTRSPFGSPNVVAGRRQQAEADVHRLICAGRGRRYMRAEGAYGRLTRKYDLFCSLRHTGGIDPCNKA
jgi:hypothetical protein